MASKKYTIQYRYLNTDKISGNGHLKERIISAMRDQTHGQEVGKNARSRIIDLDQDSSYVILNRITDPSAWDNSVFTGQIIHLQEGADVAAVLQSLEEDATEFLLRQVNLGERARVLRGVLYFASVGNHIGLLESQQVKGRTLERYLTSLLQRQGSLRVGEAVLLNSSFRAADGKKLMEAHDISISAEPNRGPSAEATRVLEDEAARVQREGSTVFDVLRTLGWDETAIESLRNEVPDDGWIEGFFRVAIKRRGRKKNISRATIDEALRNIDPSDLGLNGEGVEKGGVVKLSTQRQIRTDGSLQDPEDAVEQIVNAMREWAASGKIDCTFDE
ncbi:MAG: hypothetical protein E5Y65_08700 [Mesorhizobium sp.]|uniref:hypothetical protein n=1 Tax=Mesorhizobium sp. TaxID=1871066 RepID=UPI0012059D23|nr:hypothetical protein [Mesorhizobium sp.]TIL91705.1 MAG: hypothetical protein E5Y65_08700 [Mesorhizobium sp.]TIL99627.1 MAG: hypothetical protein E5Y64_21010 [Mesorhizobium sp.]